MTATILQLIAARAAAQPDAPALLAPGRQPLSYRALLDQIEHGLTALNCLGIGRGDRVALVLPNGPEMAAAFLGVAAGATSAPLNPAYRQSEFEFYLTDLSAKALLVEAGSKSPAVAAAQALRVPILEAHREAGAAAGRFDLRWAGSGQAAAAGLAAPGDVALVLHTSGTTARPKLVPLTQANLCASAVHIREAYRLMPDDRALNVMPLFHAQGLMVLLSSLLSGGSVVCAPGLEVERFFAWLEEYGPTWYSAAPTIHQAVLEHAGRCGIQYFQSALRFIRSSAAALPASVMVELERLFRVPVIEGYGMTESALHVTSNPLPPGRRKPGSVGVASRAEVAVLDPAGNRLPAGECGEVVIRGPNVTLGYDNNPEANRTAFIDGWLRTGDQGYLDAEGYLYITGRLKELINRGGEKVSPREVEEVLLEHPAVAQAVAFALSHPSLGEDVGAAVVLRTTGTVTGDELRRHASARLAHFKVPREVYLLEELPRGPTGKLQRIGMAERLGIAGGSGPQKVPGAYAPPRTPLEHTLCEIWQEVLGISRVGIHDSFLALGGHSLSVTQVIGRIHAGLDADVTPALFFDNQTVAELAEALELIASR